MSENSSKSTNLLYGGPPKKPLLVLEGTLGGYIPVLGDV